MAITHTSSAPHAIVVGGGWSGIASAWYLHLAGFRVDLYDRGNSLGGRSASAAIGEKTVTFGGKNIGTNYDLFREFVTQVEGGTFEYFGLNSSRIEDGRIRTIDGKARVHAVSGLLRRTSPGDLFRMIRYVGLIRAGRKNSFLNGPGFNALVENEDKTLDAVFGPYLSQQLIRSLTVRMNAAEPDEAYLGNFGTNLALLLDKFDQLAAGFDPVFEGFSKQVDVHLNQTVRQIHVESGRVAGIEVVDADDVAMKVEADVVIVSVPSWDAASLLAPHSEDIASALMEVRYFPVAVALAEYDREIFSESVRALVFPPESVLSNAGVYGIDERHLVRYTFSGRSARAFLVGNHSTEALVAAGEHELNSYVTVSGARRLNTASASWERGLCAYGKDHSRRLGRVTAKIAEIRGLALSGDYVRGASIEACFEAGKLAAESVVAPLLVGSK